jgi:membrane associated rhomboid family serine protease
VIPLKDNIPTDRFPVVTVLLIAINVAVFIWQLGFPTEPQLDRIGFTEIDQSSLEYGAIPYRITHPGKGEDCAIGAAGDAATVSGPVEPEVVCPGTEEYDEAVANGEASRAAGAPPDSDQDLTPIPTDQAPWWQTLLTSMFMHGGILHIVFNMLFLWVFGNNIEDRMGKLKFILFYLLAGLAAIYSQAGLDPDSTVPTIGASGAVAGVLGAYALLHPHARVLTLIFIVFFVTLVEIPAAILLAIWFILQFVPAIGQVATPDVGGEGGVAYFAHVGGFLFGLAAVKLFASRQRDPEPSLPAH